MNNDWIVKLCFIVYRHVAIWWVPQIWKQGGTFFSLAWEPAVLKKERIEFSQMTPSLSRVGGYSKKRRANEMLSSCSGSDVSHLLLGWVSLRVLFISRNFEMRMVDLHSFLFNFMTTYQKDNEMKPTPRHAKQDIRANEYYFLINSKKMENLFQNSPLCWRFKDKHRRIDSFFHIHTQKNNRINGIKGKKWFLRQGLSEVTFSDQAVGV